MREFVWGTRRLKPSDRKLFQQLSREQESEATSPELPNLRPGEEANMTDAFTIGLEEEYFLVDAKTKLVAQNVPAALFEAATAATGGRISPEFLQPQIEV